jgi:hypothetical protein
MDVPAFEVTMRPAASLVAYENNSRIHTQKQVDDIAASLQKFGWTNPLIVHGETIIAGHARLAAAVQLGIEEVPVIDRSDMTEAMWKAYVIADNKLAEGSTWDEDILRVELVGLSDLDFDPAVLGFGDDIERILSGQAAADEQDTTYSRTVKAPTYEITSESPPPIASLIDTAKTDELGAEIDAADIPAEVRRFLLHASQRHTVFDFHNIAEFYAHADVATQALMERSALVIIDFDKAIENGFVSAASEMMAFARDDEDNQDDEV